MNVTITLQNLQDGAGGGRWPLLAERLAPAGTDVLVITEAAGWAAGECAQARQAAADLGLTALDLPPSRSGYHVGLLYRPETLGDPVDYCTDLSAEVWVSRTPDEFRALLAREKVTVLSQTPSAFGQLLQAERAESATLAVRLIIFGGEPLDARMLLPWFDRYPESDCRVVNMFGITETTVHVTAETLTRRHALERSRSVGRPLPGWQVYVMDSERRPVPPGVTGEICVAGAGVAFGYLNHPELTSQRFGPDPRTGQRIYLSGDKGRILPDGRLEHLGRLDSQVKVRGFRIELDEIKAVLLESPGVTAAAVIVANPDTDDPAGARIDAYVVLADGVESAAGARRRATRILPDYMRPATITPLPALPLTTNGKLDVSRLPAPDVAGEPADANSAPPAVRGFARDLLTAWTAAFGRAVGPDDNFFELGGNSLYAVQLAAVMRERGWPRIPIREMYRNPTIRRLAAGRGHPMGQEANG